MGLLAVSAAVATAQQPSITKTTQMGQSETATSTRVVNATVVSVNGNKVVARDASGKAHGVHDPGRLQDSSSKAGISASPS